MTPELEILVVICLSVCVVGVLVLLTDMRQMEAREKEIEQWLNRKGEHNGKKD